MTYADHIPEVPFEPDGASAYQPRPIHDDAPFGHLLNHQRGSQAEQRQQDGLDDEMAKPPLMLKLASLSGRAMFRGAVQ